jgi:hypothetical protein
MGPKVLFVSFLFLASPDFADIVRYSAEEYSVPKYDILVLSKVNQTIVSLTKLHT